MTDKGKKQENKSAQQKLFESGASKKRPVDPKAKNPFVVKQSKDGK